MGSTTSDTTRQRLFEAAVEIFAAKGYKAATVREICRRADAANVNAVNYYFGSKAGLYRTILESMFSEFHRRYEAEQSAHLAGLSPEERLRRFVSLYCRMLFGEGGATDAMGRIFVMEMANPSPLLEEALEDFAHNRNRLLVEIVRDLLGPEAPEMEVRNCALSIAGQIFYYMFARPLLSRVFPDQPDMAAYTEELALHITRFSLGGIEAVKARLIGD